MRKFQITVNGTTYMVDVEEIGGAPMAAAPVAPVAPVAPAPVAAAPAAPAAPAPAPAAAPAPAPAPAAFAGIEPQVVAVIAAAVAAMDANGKPLVIRSIRRAPGWKRAARAEQVYRF